MAASLVSADDHIDLCYLPPDMWQQRVARRFRDDAPKVATTPRGLYWVREGKAWGNAGSRSGDGRKVVFDLTGVPENSDRSADHYSSLTVSVEQLLQAADEAGVDKIIQVVPTVMGYDNEYSIGVAKRHPERIRTFARFDPTLPDLRARLRALTADPFVLGIRIWGLGKEQNWVEDGVFEPFWPQAQALSVPVAIYAPNQAALIGKLARRFPDLTLLLDHALVRVFETRRPPSPFEGWDEVLALAEWPNIHVKVSGLPEATNEQFPFPQAQQRLRELNDRFGAERLIWGSNYPHTRRVCTYKEAVDFVRIACDFLTEEERAMILGGSLRRLLQLPW